MSELYVPPARPRVLTIGLAESEIDLIRPLVGSIVRASSTNDVHSEEYDVLILTDSEFYEGSNRFARRIAFMAPPEPEMSLVESGRMFGSNSGSEYTSALTQFTPARNLVVADSAADLGLDDLVRRSCTPQSGSPYRKFGSAVYPNEYEVLPLLCEKLDRGGVLAAVLESRDESAIKNSVFWLPDLARSALTDWVAEAFARWRIEDPETFPQTAEWRKAAQWSSPSEIEARRQLTAFDEKEERRREEIESRRLELKAAIAEAEAEGENWRGLISLSGDELVTAVQQTLNDFGFLVQDADELPQHKGQKREDLRVSRGDWIALVEVKGYGSAAKSNDMLKLTAASTVFAVAENRAPDALWLVVNAFRDIDPSQRAVPLVGREEDLKAFADNNQGCLIDTRELFKLRQLVAQGNLTAADALARLRAAKGRFSAEAPL